MHYLKPVEEKEPAEEVPRGQHKALLVEGPEDDRLRPVLHRELLPEAAFPPRDFLLGEESMLHQILDVLLPEAGADLEGGPGGPRPILRNGPRCDFFYS